MSNSIRKALLRGLGFAAAATGTFIAGPVLAAPAEQQAPQVAQSYGTTTTTTVDVVEVESVNGWYLTVGAGAVWPHDLNYKARNFSNHGDFDINAGFAIDGGIGYDFGAVRAELTYGYSAPSLDQVHSHTFGEHYDASGKINKSDIFASVYWDVLPFSRFTPYIGGGIGYTNLSTPSWTVDGVRFGSSNKGVFGWQAKAGVSYALAYNWDVYAEGTYSGAEGFSSNLFNTGGYTDFGAKLGFRYRFASPAVVVVPEPAPAPAPEPAPIPAPEPAPAPAPIRGLW
jgi:opacity protein-like surface antigen